MTRLSSDELRDDYRGAAWTVVVILVLALALAYVIYRIQRRGHSKEYHPEAGVWALAIGRRPKGRVPWVGVQLSDGTLVEGLLHSLSLDDAGDERDIALSRPIRISEAGADPTWRTELERVVLPEREIKHIIVTDVEQADRGKT